MAKKGNNSFLFDEGSDKRAAVDVRKKEKNERKRLKKEQEERLTSERSARKAQRAAERQQESGLREKTIDHAQSRSGGIHTKEQPFARETYRDARRRDDRLPLEDLRTEERKPKSRRGADMRSAEELDHSGIRDNERRPKCGRRDERDIEENTSRRRAKREQEYDAEDYDEEEEFRERRGGRRTIILIIALILVLSLLGWLGYVYIRADNITVVGNDKFTSEYIIGLSGIQPGEHILGIDQRTVEKNIAQDPYIRMKDLDYSFPNNVIIVVEERKAAAAISFTNKLIIIDKDSNILEVRQGDTAEDVPVVTGLNVTAFEIGYGMTTDDTFKQSCVNDALSAAELNGMVADIQLIDFTDINDIFFTTRGGMKVKIGLAERFDEKFAWAKAIIAELAKDGTTTGTIDVTSTGSKTYLPDATPEPSVTASIDPNTTPDPNATLDPSVSPEPNTSPEPSLSATPDPAE